MEDFSIVLIERQDEDDLARHVIGEFRAAAEKGEMGSCLSLSRWIGQVYPRGGVAG